MSVVNKQKDKFSGMDFTGKKEYFENLNKKFGAARDSASHICVAEYQSAAPTGATAARRDLLNEVENYISKHFTSSPQGAQNVCSEGLRQVDRRRANKKSIEMPAYAAVPAGASLDDILRKLDEPFNQTLMRLIDARGMTDAEVYSRANLDRRLFSKIRTDNQYRPSMKTALALAVALRLNISETNDLLKRAGFVLSHSRVFDVIIEYFIINGNYDILEINEVLLHYDQPLLGG